jgi:predicted DsbA family dithiol-disulfide isomerase
VERAEGAVANLTEQAAAEGLDFRLDIAKAGNTFDAHRLLHFAGECHRQGALKERLFSAYFTEGIEIGLPENLERLASEVGLDAGRVLESDAYADAVHADERRAYDLEVTGVPFFLINNRFMVPGAQDADTMLRVLDRAWEKSA